MSSRWEGVRLPRASGKSPDFPGSSPNFPGSFSATSPEVLSLWNLTAIQRFPGSSPNFSGSSPNFPGGQPLSLGSLSPSPDSQNFRRPKVYGGISVDWPSEKHHSDLLSSIDPYHGMVIMRVWAGVAMTNAHKNSMDCRSFKGQHD